MVQVGWENNWKRVSGRSFVGGQGRSFRAESSAGERVFIKELLHNNRRAARGRFAREVAAYETLEHPGLPKLIDHNGRDWQDESVSLYLVLEYVDGPTLANLIARKGVPSSELSHQCLARLCDIVEFCHSHDVVHRDLKPANVVIRGEEFGDPVIVDFGLSFNANNPDASDLTRVNEEVGNRFLRLPEHSTGGRSPVSDVTHLAGLYFYTLTGWEPRVLVDAEGLKPHQRAAAAEVLGVTFEKRQLVRVLSVFDRAFDPVLGQRYQTTRDLREAVNRANNPEIDDAGTFDQMMERLNYVTAQPSHVAPADNASVLDRFWRRAIAVARAFATANGLSCSQSGGPHEYSADPPFSTLELGFTRPHETAFQRVRYTFHRLGPSDVVVRIGDEDVWRGFAELSTEFENAIIQPAVELFLQQSEG
jgi:serine/threonine protein kinase